MKCEKVSRNIASRSRFHCFLFSAKISGPVGVPAFASYCLRFRFFSLQNVRTFSVRPWPVDFYAWGNCPPPPFFDFPIVSPFSTHFCLRMPTLMKYRSSSSSFFVRTTSHKAPAHPPWARAQAWRPLVLYRLGRCPYPHSFTVGRFVLRLLSLFNATVQSHLIFFAPPLVGLFFPINKTC